MIFYPARDYRRAFKRGMRGTDVGALQINLGVSVDGVFGQQTGIAVRNCQMQCKLVVDGIAGPATQQALIGLLSLPSERKYGLPEGTLKSMALNESGNLVAAFAPHPSDSGFDLGALQKSITPAEIGNQDSYRHAYDVKAMAVETAKKIRDYYESFKGKPHVLDSQNYYRKALSPEDADTYAWMLAILVHNWPSAAYNLANHGSIFQDSARDTQYAAWVDQASASRITTPREWVLSYINRCTVFVIW